MQRKELNSTSSSPEFDLVPLEVGLALHHFDKTLQETHGQVSNR